VAASSPAGASACRWHGGWCSRAFIVSLGGVDRVIWAMTASTLTADNGAALAALNRVRAHLRVAHAETLVAAGDLAGARASRARELAGLEADAVAFEDRLAFVVEADARYEETRADDLAQRGGEDGQRHPEAVSRGLEREGTPLGPDRAGRGGRRGGRGQRHALRCAGPGRRPRGQQDRTGVSAESVDDDLPERRRDLDCLRTARSWL
jgi:hypothetical protein